MSAVLEPTSQTEGMVQQRPIPEVIIPTEISAEEVSRVRPGTRAVDFEDDREVVEAMAMWIRLQACHRVQVAGSGHAGSANIAELLAVLFCRYLRLSGENPLSWYADICESLPGHEYIVWYAAKVAFGYGYEIGDLKTYRTGAEDELDSHNHAYMVDGRYNHPRVKKSIFQRWSSGDLGTPYGYMLGYQAHRNRLAALSNDKHLLVPRTSIIGIAGDGDMSEGVAAEGMRVAGKYRMTDVTLIHNRNKSLLSGGVEDDCLIPSDFYEGVYRGTRLWDVYCIENGNEPAEIDSTLRHAFCRERERRCLSTSTPLLLTVRLPKAIRMRIRGRLAKMWSMT